MSRFEQLCIPAREPWPNNPSLPVLIYPGVLDAPCVAAANTAEARERLASAFEQLFRSNGWPPAWRAGVFDFHHFHSTAHAVRGV